MQRRIRDIRRELKGIKARGEYTPEMLRSFYSKRAWDRGICDYAERLFDELLDRRNLLDYDESARIGKITETVKTQNDKAGGRHGRILPPYFYKAVNIWRSGLYPST